MKTMRTLLAAGAAAVAAALYMTGTSLLPADPLHTASLGMRTVSAAHELAEPSDWGPAAPEGLTIPEPPAPAPAAVIETEIHEAAAEPEVLPTTLEALIALCGDPEQVARQNAFFENTLFIGDSRTVGLGKYSGVDTADFFALTGMSVFDAFKKPAGPEGQEVLLADKLAARQYGKIYIMLGINELGYPLDQVKTKYDEVVALIKTAQPQAEIWLQANLHVTQGRSDKDPTFNNPTIDTLNGHIRTIADTYGVGFLDVNPIYDDENGHLTQDYTFDHTHVLGKYYKYWTMWLYHQCK